MQALWTQLTSHLNGHFNLTHLTPESAIFGFLDISNKGYLNVNHLLLRDQKHLLFETIMKNKKNISDIQKI